MANEPIQKHVFTGVFIPAKIWLHPDFTPVEKMMIAEIKALSEDNGWCFAGNSHFAKWLKCSPQNVSIYINSFKKKGFVDVKFSDEKTHSGRKMRVNLAWYHSIPNPLSPAVPPLSPAVTDIHFKDTSKLSLEGEREDEKTTPPTYDEFLSQVESEVLALEAEKKKESPKVAEKGSLPPPSIFSGFSEVYDCLEQENPGIFDTPYVPTHTVTCVEKTAVPGTITKIVEGIKLEPTNANQITVKTGMNAAGESYVFEDTERVTLPANPNATTALFNRMNLTPQATNGDEADAILTKWAAENIETVKLKYNRAKRKFTPEDLDRLIIKFCGQYASNKDTGTRERFLYDPARFFNDKLSAWLVDQPGFEKMLEPKNGIAQTETKYTAPTNNPPVAKLYHK